MTAPSNPDFDDASLPAEADSVGSASETGTERYRHDERIACEHKERCGGCPLIGLSYGEQLAIKRERVVGAAMRYPSLELVCIEPVGPAEPLIGYRTRAKLIVAPGAKLGLFAKGGGHQVVDIPHCRVLTRSIASAAATLRASIAAAEQDGGALAPFDVAGRGYLRAIDLREVLDGETSRLLVTFVVQRDRVTSLEPLRSAARELMQAMPDVAGVACNFHDGDAPQVLGAETVPLAGVTSAADHVGGSVHFATFGSFVQAHRGQAGRVHTLIADAFGLSTHQPSQLRVLDLYGGSGAIALGLATLGASVHLVESFAPAVAQARAAARALGIHVEAECAEVAAALQALVQRGKRYDAVVVNPPRRGTSPAAREWLARLEPLAIAYVSCDPETLARDLEHFARLGYATPSLRPLDMIPLTEEVETVAVLRRAEIPMPRTAYEDREIIVVDKAPHEPTTPQGEYLGSLLARVRRIAGAESAVPVHRLDVGTSGLVMFARRAEYVAKWELVLASASTRAIYLAAARGVTPSKGAVTRDLRDGGKVYAARTRYRRLAIAAGQSVLRVVPEQRTAHQIRRHLAAIGHPVLGDDRYGHAMTNRFCEERNGLDRPFLHGIRLEFEHPDSAARHIVEAPLPGDLRTVLERMSGSDTLRFLDHKNALGATGSSSFPPGPT
jgi:tRNA/tmRNA/rRNA uracil-C5-methylase (TrmA/RlmC/RlmD family)/23S rRNA-/tRNA-specific pseudouridylate synthase